MKTLMIMITTVFSYNAFSQTATELKTNIEVLTGKRNPAYAGIARSVYIHSKQKGVDPNVVLAILMTESTFNQFAVSSTGDYGIGQINPKVWSVEFKRLKRKPLNEAKLKTSTDYAVARTVEILAIVKKEDDPYWIGRYHSKTPSLKKAYYDRVQTHLSKITQKPVVLQLASNP